MPSTITHQGTALFEYQFKMSYAPVKQPMLHIENALAAAEEEWSNIVSKHREADVVCFRVFQWKNGKKQLIKDFLNQTA